MREGEPRMPPPEIGRGHEREDRPAGEAGRVEKDERRGRAEASREVEHAKEGIAELLWERPKHFVGKVLSDRLVGPLKRFLAKFGSLDDEAMATPELRKVRDEAKRAAEDGPPNP